MPSLSRLLASAETREREGARAAEMLATGLLRTAAGRPDLSRAFADFAAARSQLQAALRRIRDLAGDILPRNSAPGETLARLTPLLAHWRNVEAAVATCLSGREWPLLPERPEPLDLAGLQAELVSEVFTRAHRAVNPVRQDDAARSYGCYDDVPLSAAAFVAEAHLAYRLCLAQRRPAPLRFLDVGCGGGLKVALAAAFFDDCAGIEIDPGYAVAARRTLDAMDLRHCAVEQADALAWEGCGAFDVIYFFAPMREKPGLSMLEERIAATARPGTLLIAPYTTFRLRAADLGCVRVAGSVFLHRGDAGEAEALAGEARRIGPQVARKAPPGLGWLRPLWLACAANGIRPG